MCFILKFWLIWSVYICVQHNAVSDALYFLSSALQVTHIYGSGTGDILMDDVSCVSNEATILDCIHTTSHNCHHFEDVGVICKHWRSFSFMRGGPRCVAIITNNIFYLRNIGVYVICENAICNIYIKHCTGFTWNLYFFHF